MFTFRDVFDFILHYLVDYIDIDVTLWISWALMPLMITFLLPLMIMLLLYTSAVILYVYKYKEPLRNAYELDFWDGARKTVAALWDAHGWVWHGYDIEGLENFPEDEPVLFVYYHGALPVDLYYFIARVYLIRNKLVHTVADRFLFKIPGWSIIAEVLKVIPGTVQECSNILQNGDSLAVSPGGVYEAQFSDHNYKLMWNRRVGFAKVAIDAKVVVFDQSRYTVKQNKISSLHTTFYISYTMILRDRSDDRRLNSQWAEQNQLGGWVAGPEPAISRIVPMFTVNLREAFRQVTSFRRFWHWLYTKWRFPFIPIYGGFPVKLRTVLGPPISYNFAEGNPEALAQLAAKGINDLIEQHQKLPGSILRGVFERVYMSPKTKTQ